MVKGEYYRMRLGKPEPITNLRSEWFDWFLKDVEGYQVKTGTLALWALGGAGFILKTGECQLYIDPYCGGSVKSEGLILYRMVPLPFTPDDVRRIDAVVITHEDIDHLDENFIFPVSKNTSCLFIGPSSVTELLESWQIPADRIIMLDHYQHTYIKDVKVIAVPSHDIFAETANAYVFEVGNVRVYHSGDSFAFDKVAEIGKRYPIDIALINLGKNTPAGKWYNDPADVVDIASNLGAKVIVPMHWDLWSVSLEDPCLVAEEVQRRKLDMKVKVLHTRCRFDYP